MGHVVELSPDRRHGAGRRAEDRRAEIVRALEQDLTAVSDLVESIRADPALPEEATRGLRAVDRELTRIIRAAREAAPAPSRETADAHQLAAHLTRREWQCLDLLAQGLSTSAIADAMAVSTTTVRTHVQSLLAKLGVHSRLQAVALTTRTALLASAPHHRDSTRQNGR